MSDTKTQMPSEPTMEEILASIRRIISENDEEQEARKRADAESAALNPSRAAVSNVLELTEMVTEDGSVVSLSAANEQKPVIEHEVQTENVAAVPEIEPEGEPTDEHVQEAEVIMDSPKDDSVEFAPSTPSAGGRNNSPSSSKDEGLVSAATAAAATATFAELARTLAQEPQAGMSGSMPLGSGRTLEDLVKEMIRPMLKDWLDKNLQQIVEHAVRRELDRMTRRAEDI
jgi:cell pole-organizing protein PopZ